MVKVTSVDAYIQLHSNWLNELAQLRTLLLQTSLTETIKWNAPTYTINNKNVVGLGAFKNYIGLWFFNGVFINDHYGVLLNAQDGKTKAMRQWRFQSESDINNEKILDYVKQAIANEQNGKRIIPSRSTQTSLELPAELEHAFNKDENLRYQFEQLTFYKRKEYAEHIASAKREATRLSRLEKAISLIHEGKGLHDKYKNC